MVLWCKCGAFMGLREPVSNWSVDRTGICPECAKKAIAPDVLAKKGVPVEPPADPPARRADE